MVSFPNAKINLGLNILGKRADGFHDLQTVFYPVMLRDALEFIPNESGQLVFSSSGLVVDGHPEDNLCFKAYQLLKKDYPQLPGLKIHLHKHIPMGAGLGGGSADAAFMLKMINEHFELKMDAERLMQYAAMLGSDCPFFILNKPCVAKGRGERLSPIELNLSGYSILLINPGIHINTGWAFRSLSQHTDVVPVEELINLPIEKWQGSLSNDFEIPVFAEYPEIAAIKEKLIAAGAVYASMSGSGSSVFGIFKSKPVSDFNFPQHYFQIWL